MVAETTSDEIPDIDGTQRTKEALVIQTFHFQQLILGNVKNATLELNYKTEQTHTFRKHTMAAERER